VPVFVENQCTNNNSYKLTARPDVAITLTITADPFQQSHDRTERPPIVVNEGY
jgi:hypothetical protein